MEILNRTLATEFILLGFSVFQKANVGLFILIFVIYLLTCIGNLLIIAIVIINTRLHTPMYFFLCNLSFIDLCYSSNALPRFLRDIFSTHKVISLGACIIQVYISLLLGVAECLLLVVMAYDRYAAICHPLHYTVIMSWEICYLMAVIAWVGSFIIIILPSLAMPVPLCNPNQIDHFTCEFLAVVKLACENAELSELIAFCISFISIITPFIFIIASYICIIATVLKIDSVARGKAFSTCASHLTVVCLYFGTGMTMYSGSLSSYIQNQQKYISAVYIIIIRLVNPLIYCLKNHEVTDTFKKMLTYLCIINNAKNMKKLFC